MGGGQFIPAAGVHGQLIFQHTFGPQTKQYKELEITGAGNPSGVSKEAVSLQSCELPANAEFIFLKGYV